MREANQKSEPFLFAKRDANLKLALRQRNDGGRSLMVEPQIVVLVVAGSSPVGHPTKNLRFSVLDFRFPARAVRAAEGKDRQSKLGDREFRCVCSSTG